MQALITGGCGFIGSHLAEALLDRGDAVTVVDDLSTGQFRNIEHLVGRPGFRFAIETITNHTVMDRLISECDIIYHLAAAVGVELIVRDPVHTLETNINSLEVSLENLTASESTIRDADFAVETANLTRAQILVEAGTSVLSTANLVPQVVLALLS